MWIIMLVLLLLGAQLKLTALVPLQPGDSPPPVILSILLQVIWFTGWAVLPLLVDVALLWAVFGQHVTVSSLRG